MGPCDGDDPAPECSQDCAPGGAPCPAGFYCGSEALCTADCTPTEGCAEGALCGADGRCMDVRPMVDAMAPDSPEVCADIDVTTMQVTPSVILIVDQSGSMEDNDLTPGVTRWDALQDALVGPPGVAGSDGMGPGAEGLVFDLQAQVRFGLALYSGEDMDMCPLLTVEPSPLSGVMTNAYPPIKVTYDMASPIRWTPTHLAMRQVLDQVLATPPPDPVLFILATDGQPNECERDTSATAEAEVISETQRAYDAGISTYVISLAGDDMDLQAHLDEVANAGQGLARATDPPAVSYAPADTDGLRDALTSIIGGALSCILELNGRIVDPDMACSGSVLLDGTPLVCDDPDGWHVVDETHIEVTGAACDTLLGTPGSTLTAQFPCGVISLI